LCFSNKKAKDLAAKNIPVILVHVETSSDDIVGLNAATGVLTVRGGMTSHAAVVARGIAKPAVVGTTNTNTNTNTTTNTNTIFI
jgi:pyruvate,orthophosphate dikinase